MNTFKIILISLLFPVSSLVAQTFEESVESDSLGKVNITYTKKGFQFQTIDNHFLLQIQSRLQFRYAIPGDQNPLTLNDFVEDSRASVFKINRARLKVGGHAFQPWLKYYWEYELYNSNILNYTVSIEKWKWLSFKVGQWKVEYTRERRISSGEQQLVDRSIINRPFTIDRQQGVEVYGRVQGGFDFNYWLAVLTGTGRGTSENDDKHLMYFGRLQWNMLGEPLGFEFSDLERHENPSVLLALSGVTNRSPYTRFSQAGGGELEGFENGEAGQYRVNQLNVETAMMWQGFSWASEVHGKWITDELNGGGAHNFYGYYVQSGYFFNELLDWWPRPMELAIRYAEYFPSSDTDERIEGDETSLAVNYFFNGHKNKLTSEISFFEYEETQTWEHDWRFRIQWDISF